MPSNDTTPNGASQSSALGERCPPYVSIKLVGGWPRRAVYRRQTAAGEFRRPLPLSGIEGFEAAYSAAHAECQRERAWPGTAPEGGGGDQT